MSKEKYSTSDGGASDAGPGTSRSLARWAVIIVAWFCILLLTAWSVAALYFDFPWPRLRLPLAAGYAVCVPVILFLMRSGNQKLAACFGGFVLVLAWWLTLKPSDDHVWQADVAETPWAEVDGDIVNIHNLRDCKNVTEFDYTCEWITKTVRLSDLRGIDV